MKKYLILIILAAISCISVPLALIKESPADVNTKPTDETTTENTTQAVTETGETIAVFRTVGNETVDMTMFEYVCGSVAAEMPLAYHEEAIKAQAVACYTNALRLKNSQSDAQKGDISDDSKVHQGYIDEAQRREKWGEDFEKYEQKLKEAVKAVENEALYYNGELCVAAFYAISCGKTEDAENIWGTEVPYLKSVKSEGDKLSPQYASTVSFNREDFIKYAKNLDLTESDISDIKTAVKITEKSDSGTVLSATVCDKNFTGEEVRKAFSLRSPVFTVKTTADTVTFSVSGYGHGVGLSQYGSDYMARQGSTYKEILEHYYTDIEIKKSN